MGSDCDVAFTTPRVLPRAAPGTRKRPVVPTFLTAKLPIQLASERPTRGKALGTTFVEPASRPVSPMRPLRLILSAALVAIAAAAVGVCFAIVHIVAATAHTRATSEFNRQLAGGLDVFSEFFTTRSLTVQTIADALSAFTSSEGNFSVPTTEQFKQVGQCWREGEGWGGKLAIIGQTLHPLRPGGPLQRGHPPGIPPPTHPPFCRRCASLLAHACMCRVALLQRGCAGHPDQRSAVQCCLRRSWSPAACAQRPYRHRRVVPGSL
jgi:hypothetical protein